MIDYEDLILQRQEEQEIFEDDPDMWSIMFCSDTPQTERSACDICIWPNRGIPCGVRDPKVCKREV